MPMNCAQKHVIPPELCCHDSCSEARVQLKHGGVRKQGEEVQTEQQAMLDAAQQSIRRSTNTCTRSETHFAYALTPSEVACSLRVTHAQNNARKQD